MFRNCRFYRVTSAWPGSERELSDVLGENSFSPCSAYSERSAGWESPAADANGSLCRRLNGADLFQLRTQTRVLPPAAIKEALEEKVIEFRRRMEKEPGRGEIRRMKEDIKEELLPKTLLKSERSRGCFIHAESLLVIDAPTLAKTEWFIDQLRTCFGQFACVPLAFGQAPGELLQRIFHGENPSGFSLGQECRMQDLSDSRGIATWRNIELADRGNRLKDLEGMKLTHLGVNFEEILSCVINEDGDVSKLRLIGEDEADRVDSHDPQARLDADFVLLTGALRRLNEAMKALLGGYQSA